MCKTCVYTREKYSTNLFTFIHFRTSTTLNFNELRKNQHYTQHFQPIIRIVMHIKFSLNLSVRSSFSTVSTHPTIKTTNSLINKLLIKHPRSLTAS